MENTLLGILVPSITLLGSVVTASLTYFFTRRSQIRENEKRIKEEFFRKFIKTLSDVAMNNKSDNAQLELSESINTLLLIASPKVIKSLMEFHDHVKLSNINIPRDSSEWLETHNTLLGLLIQQMRLDLFGDKKVNKEFPQIHLVGKGR